MHPAGGGQAPRVPRLLGRSPASPGASVLPTRVAAAALPVALAPAPVGLGVRPTPAAPRLPAQRPRVFRRARRPAARSAPGGRPSPPSPGCWALPKTRHRTRRNAPLGTRTPGAAQTQGRRPRGGPPCLLTGVPGDHVAGQCFRWGSPFSVIHSFIHSLTTIFPVPTSALIVTGSEDTAVFKTQARLSGIVILAKLNTR